MCLCVSCGLLSGVVCCGVCWCWLCLCVHVYLNVIVCSVCCLLCDGVWCVWFNCVCVCLVRSYSVRLYDLTLCVFVCVWLTCVCDLFATDVRCCTVRCLFRVCVFACVFVQLYLRVLCVIYCVLLNGLFFFGAILCACMWPC